MTDITKLTKLLNDLVCAQDQYHPKLNLVLKGETLYIQGDVYLPVSKLKNILDEVMFMSNTSRVPFNTDVLLKDGYVSTVCKTK